MWLFTLKNICLGVSAVCISYPFDLLKTRTQFTVSQSGPIGVSSVARMIFKEGYHTGGIPKGFIGFYRGIDQLIPEAFFKTMLRFITFKELNKQYMAYRNIDNMDVFGNLLCGGVAGAIETTIVVQPFERGKTLKAAFKRPFDVYKQMYYKQGLKAMIQSVYTGYGATLGRQVGNQACSFTVFYELKHLYLNHTGQDMNTFARLFGGFTAGASACIVTMPMDVAKTIAQKQTDCKHKSTLMIMREVIKQRGLKGLYSGLIPRIARVGVDRAFGFLTFEWLCEKLATHFKMFQLSEETISNE